MKSIFRVSALVGLFLGSSLPIAPALAQSATNDQPQTKPSSDATARGWVVTLGAGAEYGPSYQGATDQSFSFVPYLDIRRFGEPAEPDEPDDNFDLTLITLKGLEIGPVAGFRDGRSTSDDSALAGLNEFDWTIDAGIFAQYWIAPNRFRLRFEGRWGAGNNDGFLAEFFADYFQPVGPKLTLSAGPRMSFADSSYMHTNFGITPQESAANGSLPAFDIGGGIKSVGVLVAATYQFNDNWNVQVYDRYDRLVGDPADSPIVTQIGSPNQNRIGFILRRSFDIKF
jgi:outer membrane scaffolding protein for murein synthesis (MipA/OmpV family)